MTDNNTPRAEAWTIPYSDRAYSGIQVTSDEDRSGRVVVTDAPQGLPEGSVLATAVNKIGEPTSKPDAASIVIVNGIAMPMQFAVNEGFLTANSDGSYSDVDVNAFNARRAAEHKAAEEAAEAQRPQLDPQAASDLADIQKGLAEMGLDITTVLAESLGSGNWTSALGALAHAWGVDTEEVQAKTQRVLDSLEAEWVNRRLAPAGVDLDSFYGWLLQAPSKHERNAALITLAVGGSFAGYDKMLHDYLNSKAYIASARVPEGAETRVNEKGETFVKVAGYPWMTLGASHVLRIK